jgi:glutaminase
MHATYERDRSFYPSKEEIESIFTEAYENGLECTGDGAVADYIPELAKADPNAFGIYMLSSRGESFSIGDTDKRFTIQSISKVINLAVSLKFRGFRDTFSHVMMEPSGDAFNSILKLDTRSSLPFKPMINAGAIQTVKSVFHVSDEQLEVFAAEFYSRLPEYMQKALGYTQEAVCQN